MALKNGRSFDLALDWIAKKKGRWGSDDAGAWWGRGRVGGRVNSGIM